MMASIYVLSSRSYHILIKPTLQVIDKPRLGKDAKEKLNQIRHFMVLAKKKKINIEIEQNQRLTSGVETGRARPSGASSPLVERDITGFILTT